MKNMKIESQKLTLVGERIKRNGANLREEKVGFSSFLSKFSG